MLRKLIIVAFILVFANQSSVFAELTPLQKKTREAFHLEAEKVEEETEEVVEEKTSTESFVNEEKRAAVSNDIIVAEPDNEDENNPAEDYKTASEVSSNGRTAVINKKWSIEALGWNTELDGHVKIAKNKNTPVTDAAGRIDLGSETSIDKKKVPGLKLSYRKGGRASFEFNWVKVEQDGHLVLAGGATKEFKGKVYAGNADFEINNSMYDLLWKYRFTHKIDDNGREKSYVAGLLGIKASDMKFKIDGEATENGNPIGRSREEKSETIPVPYIGVEAGTFLGDNLYLKGYIRYLKLNNIKNYDAEHCDYDISLSYKISNKDGNQDLFLDVGYRKVSYDVEGEGNDIELKYKGPYVGLEFLF